MNTDINTMTTIINTNNNNNNEQLMERDNIDNTVSVITTNAINPTITVFFNDRSKNIPFNMKEHDSLKNLHKSICQSFDSLKYQKKIKLIIQMKTINNELIKITSNESWKILFNELLKNNSITLYVNKKTKLTEEERELIKKEKKELRELQKHLRKQERELHKELKKKKHLKKEGLKTDEDTIIEEFEGIEIEEESPKRRKKDLKREERKKEKELKKLERKELKEKKKQKEEQSISEQELNEMKRIYLDGNNMMYVTKVLRDLTLKRRDRKLAEKLLIKITKLFKEHEAKDYVHICFDSTSDLSLIENENDSFIVSSARKEGFKIADDYLVELAGKEVVDNNTSCLFVTCDRELRIRLKEKGVRIIGSGNWLKLAHSKLCDNVEAMDIDDWMTKLLEEM
ncbi:hypothetical protein ABK040_013725 [Willaertia magna]